MPKQRVKSRGNQVPGTLKGCLGKILTPQILKKAHQAFDSAKSRQPSRWDLHPLLMVLLLFAWSSGDSQEARFQAARAAYVRLYPKRKRPGCDSSGFRAALRVLPICVLKVVANAVRLHLLCLFGSDLYLHGYIPIGVDGSRLSCPFTEELHRNTGQTAQEGHTCNIWVTAMVHLSTGMLLCWRLGPADSSERYHLRRLLSSLPKAALLIADAGYQGFELASLMSRRGLNFLIRVSVQTKLHTTDTTQATDWQDGKIILWPKDWRGKEPPLELRLLCVRDKKRKVDVWLLTNVLDQCKLPLANAALFYQLRWESEQFFRTFKRTLKQVKLSSRKTAMLYREAHGALLATMLLLAQGAWVQVVLLKKKSAVCSPRRVLRAIRREMAGDGDKRRKNRYLDELKKAQRERRPRKKHKEKRRFPQRRSHKPPTPPELLILEAELKALVQQHLVPQ